MTKLGRKDSTEGGCGPIARKGTENYSPVVLRDRLGRKFRPSSRAETALMMEGDRQEILPEIQPGVETVVHERDTFGTKRAVISVKLEAGE